MKYIFYMLDYISIKYIEWRSDWTRNEIVALYRLSKKRNFKRIKYVYPNEGVWRCVDECIFCNNKITLFENKYHHNVEMWMEGNPIKFSSLLDMKGTWK